MNILHAWVNERWTSEGPVISVRCVTSVNSVMRFYILVGD